jgi:O-antigen ligase
VTPEGVAEKQLMDFILFLLVNAVLFIRPAEIVPGLEDLPLYEVAILACLAVSFFSVLRQLRPRSLVQRPITVCVLGLLPAIVLSGLPRFWFTGAVHAGADFGKIVVYYLLFVATVNSAARLRWFLLCLTGLILVVAALALLQYHGLINVPALAAVQQAAIDAQTGEESFLPRLQGTGLFNDPNDLSLILIVGMGLCLYWLNDPSYKRVRLLWVAPLAGLGYAVLLTQSRGGFLAMLAGVLVFCQARFGWRKALLPAGIAVPLILVLFAGRQTSIDVSNPNDTAQVRLAIWSNGLMLFRQAPAFGIGYGKYQEEGEARHVAHNSYLHSYTELGIVGGSLFVGAFYLAFATVRRAWKGGALLLNPALQRLYPYLLAILVAYMVGLWSLSRGYVTPTYTILALATVYGRLALPGSSLPPLRLDLQLLKRVALANVVTLLTIQLFVRLLVLRE